MLDLDTALTRAQSLVTAARRAGADAADVIYSGDASTDVQVRLGALEDVTRSESEQIGLRVFVGQRSATVSAADLSPVSFETLVERCVAMAREAPEDPYAGLAPADMLLRKGLPALDLYDPTVPDPAAMRARAMEAEDAARSAPGITNSEGAGASHGEAQVALVTSHGFAGSYRGSSHSIWASVIAGEGSDMQRDYASHSSRHLRDLDAAETVGNRAAQRAVARLNPRRITGGTMPVIFDPRIGSSMIGHLVGAMTGPAITRRSSFLLDRAEDQIFDSAITIYDDPHRVRGLRSRPFDGEGLPTTRRSLVKGGKLTGWLLESASARQLGLTPTGHATRGGAGSPGAGTSNVHMAAGSTPLSALYADVETGIYVTELIGHGVNGVTGDYSRGAAGFLIERGATAHAVSEITIAGNLIDMFAALTPADDLEFRYATNVPTLRIDGMMVASA